MWRWRLLTQLKIKKEERKEMERFRIFERFSEVMGCGFSLRGEDFYQGLGVENEQVVLANQGHTDKVLRVEKGGEVYDSVDGFMTNVESVVCTAKFADCQGVFMFDPVRKVVCSVHSGWRGNAQNIIGKAVVKLGAEYGCRPTDLVVGISASLGKCCAEFSEPLVELPQAMHRYVEGKFVDLLACCRDQLLAEGVLGENIEFDGRCTKCNPELFYSFRRGDEGRMLGGIWLKTRELEN